jgi:hypothetical protein
MPYQYSGNAPSDRAAVITADTTYIGLVLPIPIRGKLRVVELYGANNVNNCKLKLFRDDGTNYVFVSALLTFNMATGLNTLTLTTDVHVEQGDLLGLYGPAGVGALDKADSGGSDTRKSGDVTTTTAKADWTADDDILSIRGTIFKKAGIM